MNKTADERSWVKSGDGVERKVLAHDPALMVVEFRFAENGVGAPHRHVHTQSTFVKSGVFDFTVGGETHRLVAGDSIVIPSNVEHGCVTVEPGSLIDTFAPRRDDFL